MTMLCLAGDVMTGRGIDQVLPHPGDPTLNEPHVRDARYYVYAAERRHGTIPRPVTYSWPWGRALRVVTALEPDACVLNLETAVTAGDDFAVGKAVCYRMNPGNLRAVLMPRPDVCVLANNHVLDFGARGLIDTLAVLKSAGVATAGAGRTATEAARPAVVRVRHGHRVVVFAAATESSGVPTAWAATPGRPGVRLLADLSSGTAHDIATEIASVKRFGDVVVFSVHWGSNWGYQVPPAHVEFAHRLVAAGADVVHGHSSHHPRPVEIYHGKPIFYGCGDLINDYEGIGGFEDYRDELRLLYFPSFDEHGVLTELRMLPLRAERFRLRAADPGDAAWLRETLARISAAFGTRISRTADGMLVARHHAVADTGEAALFDPVTFGDAPDAL
ncbi:CapA family protein [Saccharomonospora sp. NPDC046836]|uniref:CapA family protein n=1 Tax=Saccharomonospora sp. NPDC046836 TaxID=3156921 RepID=UPI0033C6F267